MLDYIFYPLRNIWRKKGRSSLTIIGIAIGVASVIIISAIGNCGTKAVSNEMNSLGMGGLTVSAAENSGVSLTENELEIVRNTTGIKSATPVAMLTTDIFDATGKSENSIVWGVDQTAKDVVSLELLYGRYLNNSDISSAANYCMVDQSFARNLFNMDNVVGRVISFGNENAIESFTIVGVLKTGSGLLQGAMGNIMPNFIYAPYTSVFQLTSSNSFNQIITRVNDDVNIEKLGNNLQRQLNLLNGTENKFTVSNLAKQKAVLTNILSIVTLILSAVAAVSLVVASLSIMTVMLVSVSERKREIGIKKSIGASKITILREFLLEALVLSICGCIIGIIAGLTISFIGSLLLNIDIDMRFDIMLYTCLFSIGAGVVFGVYPALKAAKLNPADTLRQN